MMTPSYFRVFYVVRGSSMLCFLLRSSAWKSESGYKLHYWQSMETKADAATIRSPQANSNSLASQQSQNPDLY
jgi:hypothetical protein